MRVYLDANIVIYVVDQHPVFGPQADALIARILERGDDIVVSPLVRMECRVGPLRRGDPEQLGNYDAFFAGELVELDTVEVSSVAFDLAAELRAHHGFRPMDALNLATAITVDCQAFATHDFRLRRFPDIQIITLTP